MKNIKNEKNQETSIEFMNDGWQQASNFGSCHLVNIENHEI